MGITGTTLDIEEMKLVDINHDAFLDLVSISVGNGVIQARLGNGIGGFLEPFVSVIGTPLETMAMGQFDSDHHLHIVALSFNALRVWRGDGIGGFTALSVTVVPPGLFAIATGDFNGDRRDDIIGHAFGATNLEPGSTTDPGVFCQASPIR